jgi:chemotaxis protein MotA
MDITTIIGIVLGLGALIGGFLLEGGHIDGLLQYTALLIVFGGTAAAVTASFPWSKLKTVPDAFRFAFQKSDTDAMNVIDRISEMALMARREGVLSLEADVHAQPIRFLREGLIMVIDGTDPELTRQILEMDIDAMERKREQQAKIFESAGAYSPTMGIIGTVMGLIHVLGNLADPSSLGPSIAVAFTATLYGVASANIIYLPIATKIKARLQDEVRLMEMMLEGILAVQAGENPQLIRKKLLSFMSVDELIGTEKVESIGTQE